MSDMTTRTTRRVIMTMIVLALIAAGCTGDSVSSVGAGYTPTFSSTECPGSVRASATRETTCGFLMVPEDRSNPGGRQIQVFVVRLRPNNPTDAPPVVYVGTDLGSSFDDYELSGMADHLDGPEVIGIEERGTGFSQPNLACPEVDAIAPRTLATSIGDPAARQAFIDAVKSCHDRFVDQGIDLSAYGVEQAGADVLDLVRALGLTHWDVVTKGSTSRIVFAAMRTDPPGLRAVVAYNPEFPDTDTFVQAFEGTRSAVAELEKLCEADSRCARRFPDLGVTFDSAIRRFDDHPLTVSVKGTSILVDGARLLRDFRGLLGTIASDVHMYLHLPATIDALAHAKDPAGTAAGWSHRRSRPRPFAWDMPLAAHTQQVRASTTRACAETSPHLQTAVPSQRFPGARPLGRKITWTGRTKTSARFGA